MKKFLAALVALSLPASCMTPAMAVEVNDAVGVRLACKSAEIAERQVKEYVAHGDEGVQARMQADIDNGDCAIAPATIPMQVQEIGKSFQITWNGKPATLTIVRIAGTYWTVVIEEATDA